MQPLHALQAIGFSSQEAAMYLTTLKMGTGKAGEIAQKAGVSREGTYYTLKQLRKKGLVNEFLKNNIKHYSAATPQRILELLKDEQEQRKAVLEEVLPQISSLRQTAITCPLVETFEGIEGFRMIMSKVLARKHEQIRCYVTSSVLEWLPAYHPQFRRQRKESNIRMQVITQRTPLMKKLQKKDGEELRATRFYDAIFVDLNVLYYILNDAVVSVKADANEQTGIYIKDTVLATMQATIFDTVWKCAREK